jgi:endonuclease I
MALAGRWAVADAYDPPATYYKTAIGTGATLKSKLNEIIDGHTSRSYDSLRSDLQVTDVDPNDASRIVLIYNNRQSIAKPTGGSIPGWDSGVTWNREHSWPQSRGLDSTASPDGSDMHHLFPSDPGENSTRGNLNFGGVFGAQGFGVVNDGGTKYYPGDFDAGMVARAQFYMAVRYDGADSGTANLELVTGNPGNSGTTLGDLNRLIEWHFAAPPDSLERRRNQIIYDNYQHNRNPFIDRPEYAWSVFMNDTNNSQIAIDGATVNADGSSTQNVDLGRVFVGGSVPAAQALALDKTGNDGTYYEVTAAGAATSSVAGRLNAFRSGTTGTTAINVGLNTSTATAGLKSGTVTVNNLDVTMGGGAGRGANDSNDLFNVSLAVVDHATPSFASPALTTTLVHDFGSVLLGSGAPTFQFDLFNLVSTIGFTADLDFDSVLGSGDVGTLGTNLAGSAGSLTLDAGTSQSFMAMLNTAAVGTFAATYTLMLSDENLPGALNMVLTLSLAGVVEAAANLAGDYNLDGSVDAADYVVWRATNGQGVTPYSGADGDGSGMVDDLDYLVWTSHYGEAAGAAGAHVTMVPEPGSLWLAFVALIVWRVKNLRHPSLLCRLA